VALGRGRGGRGEKGGTAAGSAFYGGPVARAERKKGRGIWGSTPRGGENGEERERASGATGTA
jgi:hypothetical protein